MPKLVIRTGEKKGLVYRLDDKEVSLGRGPSNTIVLPDRRVSRFHARIIHQGEEYVLEDLESTNGTMINNSPVTRKTLNYGDEILIGAATIAFLSLSAREDLIGKVSGRSLKVVQEEKTAEDLTMKMALSPGDVRSLDVDLSRPDIKALQEAYQRLMILYRINYNLGAITEMSKVLDNILELVLEVMDADRGCVMLIDEDTKGLIPQTAMNRNGAGKDTAMTVSKTITAHVLNTGESVLISNVAGETRFKKAESVILAGIHSAICVPVKTKEKILGIMYVDSKVTALGFVRADLELLAAISNQAAMVIENAKLFDDLKRANLELKERQAQLIEAEKLSALGKFSSGIAHEINNPLTSIISYVELSYERLTSGRTSADDIKKCADFLKIAVNEVNRCRRVTQNLLQFARRGNSEMAPADINEILESALIISQYHMRKANINMVKNSAAGLPRITVDKDQIQQVFLNMIINAKDAMELTGGQLTITTSNIDNKWVEIKFEDTGCGIPKDKLETVFKPLYTTKPEGKGTGLGLSISLEIVERHKGTIDVESEVGKGTTFFIRLPVQAKLK
ncbi:MAG: ATP-binding protein [Candidatus Omnitrophica bacterium]|nr:ATP-binding protein [Candidatus Omnitrophota bacterium]